MYLLSTEKNLTRQKQTTHEHNGKNTKSKLKKYRRGVIGGIEKKLIMRRDSEHELFYEDIFNHFYAVRPGSHRIR